jgi:hypothetical protein
MSRRVSHETLSSTFLQAVKSEQWQKAQGTFCSDTSTKLISEIKSKQQKSGVVGKWKFIKRGKGRKVNFRRAEPLMYQVTNAQGKTKPVTIELRFDIFDEGACITDVVGL